MKKVLLIAAFMGLMIGVACNKDDSVSTPTKTDLIAKSWKISALKIDTGGIVFDSLAVMPACVLDNVLKFVADSTYSYEEGLTKCDISDPQVVYSGTWYFMSNGTKLNLDGDTWDVMVLTSTMMKIKITVPAEGEIPTFTIEITMVPV